MIKTQGEQACVAAGTVSAPTIVAWGLLGQWVGGTFDNVGTSNQIGIWAGPDSVLELLAPAWNDSTVAVSVASATAGIPVLLYAGADGRLTSTAPTSAPAIARVMDRPSAARLVIQMLV